MVTWLSDDRLKLNEGAFGFILGSKTGVLSDINDRPCYLSIIYLLRRRAPACRGPFGVGNLFILLSYFLVIIFNGGDIVMSLHFIHLISLLVVTVV